MSQQPAVVSTQDPNISRRVLIFDANNEYGEFGVKTMRLEHIELFMRHPNKEIRRIAPFTYDSNGRGIKMDTDEMVKTLGIIVKTYMGGGLVVEDPNKYIGDNMTDDVTGAICTNRHNSCDMIMHYQSIARPLPKIHQNTNLYRFHYQSDDVDRSENKLMEMTQLFKIAQILVNRRYYSGDKAAKRFFVYIDKDSGKIIGDFGMEEFIAAVEEYISYNAKELKPWTTKRDSLGKLMFTYGQALEAFKQLVVKKYWGNDFDPDNEREAMMMIASGFKGVGKTYETMRFLREDYCPPAIVRPR